MKTDPEIKSKLLQLPYFTLNTLRQLTGGSLESSRVLLSRWGKSGEVMRIKRGFYMTKELWLSYKENDKMIPFLATVIDPQSYLTGSWVLQKYQIMTEAIYEITSATTTHSKVIENDFGRFVYSHIPASLFDHYTQIDCYGVLVHQATPSKALFDYLYLQSDTKLLLQADYDLAEDLRLNLSEWSREWRDEFSAIVTECGKAKMIKINANLRRYVWR